MLADEDGADAAASGDGGTGVELHGAELLARAEEWLAAAPDKRR